MIIRSRKYHNRAILWQMGIQAVILIVCALTSQSSLVYFMSGMCITTSILIYKRSK